MKGKFQYRGRAHLVLILNFRGRFVRRMFLSIRLVAGRIAAAQA
jgi:hypothetical protein